MDSELGMKEENCTKSNIMYEINNENTITSSINLTNKVMNVIDNLIFEQFRHKEYQNNCFEELIKTWFGEKFLADLTILDIEKETDKFDDCKAYIL